MALPDPLNKSLQATASVVVAELFTEGKAAANDNEEWPYAQISELLDGNTCPLCAAVDGKVLRVGTPEYARWRGPSHINCRRVIAFIGKDESGDKDWFQEPDPELVKKHGHFHVKPEKHAALRIPAEPAGRHVVVRRVKNAETGETKAVLDWAPWWEQVPQTKKALVLKARVAPDADLPDLLQKLGITDTSDPEQLRQATLLGLRDRLDGWVDAPTDPGEDRKRKFTTAELEAAKAKATAELEQLRGGVEKATGLTSRWKGEVIIREDADFLAAKPYACQIEVRADVADAPDRWRSYICELIHSTSAGYNPVDFMGWPGWEEGVNEALQRLLREEILGATGVEADVEVVAARDNGHHFSHYLEALESLRAVLQEDARTLYLELLATPIKDRATLVMNKIRARPKPEFTPAVRIFSKANATLKERPPGQKAPAIDSSGGSSEDL